MAMSIKDKETCKYLVDLSRDILNEYNSLDNGTFCQERMLSLLDMEDDLLNSMDLTREVLNEIEDTVQNKIGTRFNNEMLPSMSPFMTDVTYPYIRLLSRVRYRFKCKNEKSLTSSSPCFQDLEVALLYKSLVQDSNVHSDIYDFLQKSARTVLMDSPQTEREVVLSNMEPLDKIDDVTEFQANFFGIVSQKNREGIIKSVENEIICARAIRFAINCKEIIDLLYQYLGLRNSGQDVTTQVMMYIAYLKTIVSTQLKQKREHLYKEFFNDNLQSIKEDPEYAHYIKHCISDIETTLVPSIRRISFMNKPSIN